MTWPITSYPSSLLSATRFKLSLITSSCPMMDVVITSLFLKANLDQHHPYRLGDSNLISGYWKGSTTRYLTD
jgi:hypothetical protein